jgi:hypothetical protein
MSKFWKPAFRRGGNSNGQVFGNVTGRKWPEAPVDLNSNLVAFAVPIVHGRFFSGKHPEIFSGFRIVPVAMPNAVFPGIRIQHDIGTFLRAERQVG